MLPCSSPPPYLRCDARGRVLRVSPTPALSRGGLDPPGAPTSFPPLASQRLPRRLEPPAPSPPRSGGFGCFEASLPPRSRCERRSGLPSRRCPCSPGLPPLQSLPPVEPRVLFDPADHSVRRGASTAATGRATPRRWVRPLRPHGRVGLVGAYRSALRTRTGTCRLSATTLPPSTLEPAVTRLPLVLGGSKDSTSDPSARDGLLSWGSLPRRRPRDFARRADPGAVSASPLVPLETLTRPSFAGASSASSPRARLPSGSVTTRSSPCEDGRVATVSAIRAGSFQIGRAHV